MVGIGIAVGVAAVAAFMLTGYLIGLAVSTPGEVRPPAGGTPSTCAEFCSAWQTSRVAVCNAQNDLRAALAWETTTRQAYLNLLAGAAVLVAASAVAAAVPIFGPGIPGENWGQIKNGISARRQGRSETWTRQCRWSD